MKQIFSILKLQGFLCVLGTMIALIAASYNVHLSIYPIFGTGLIYSMAIIAITYSKLGKIYFSNLFRVMIILLAIVQLIELTDAIHNILTDVQFANTTLAFIVIAFVSGLLSFIITKKDKKDE